MKACAELAAVFSETKMFYFKWTVAKKDVAAESYKCFRIKINVYKRTSQLLLNKSGTVFVLIYS